MGCDFDCRMHPRSGGATDQQRNGELFTLHFPGNMRHFFQRRGDQAGQTDHIDLFTACCFQNLCTGDHHPMLMTSKLLHCNTTETIFLPISCTSPLTVAITTLPLGLLSPEIFLCLDVRQQIGNRLLHHPCRLDHLWQKHLACAKQIPHYIHAVHERAFDHLDRLASLAVDLLPDELGILDDVGADTLTSA